MRAANAASPLMGFQAKPNASRPAQMLSPLAPIVYVPVVDSYDASVARLTTPTSFTSVNMPTGSARTPPANNTAMNNPLHALMRASLQPGNSVCLWAGRRHIITHDQAGAAPGPRWHRRTLRVVH